LRAFFEVKNAYPVPALSQVEGTGNPTWITGLHGDVLKVRIAAPATDNRANAALIEFLSEALGVPRSAIAIRQGARGRRKILEITGGPELQVRAARLL
jgi:uncharacterized protein (TIGR00251 family)